MPTQIIPNDVVINGSLRYSGGIVGGIPRSDMLQESLAAYQIPWTSWRVWNALGTNLPGTSSSDDLGLYGGTWGTNTPSIQTYDVKNVGATTLYARTTIQLPAEYVAGQTVTLRFHAGMLTTIASVSATLDVEAYLSDSESLVSGSDLCATAATTINSVSLADKDFVITPATLSPGGVLDVRIAIAVNDSGTATVVAGLIGAATLLCDIQG